MNPTSILGLVEGAADAGQAWRFRFTLSDGRRYEEWLEDPGLESWLGAHLRAFRAFSGVPPTVELSAIPPGLADERTRRAWADLIEHFADSPRAPVRDPGLEARPTAPGLPCPLRRGVLQRPVPPDRAAPGRPRRCPGGHPVRPRRPGREAPPGAPPGRAALGPGPLPAARPGRASARPAPDPGRRLAPGALGGPRGGLDPGRATRRGAARRPGRRAPRTPLRHGPAGGGLPMGPGLGTPVLPRGPLRASE